MFFLVTDINAQLLLKGSWQMQDAVHEHELLLEVS